MVIADCWMVILPCRAARATVSKTHIAAVFNNGNDTHYTHRAGEYQFDVQEFTTDKYDTIVRVSLSKHTLFAKPL